MIVNKNVELKNSFDSIEEQIENNYKWKQYWATLANQNHDNVFPHGKYLSIFEQVMKNIDFYNVHSVFDLGCGIGDFSLLFANEGKRVIAFDMVNEVLTVLANRAKVMGITSFIQPCYGMFEQFNVNSTYDVVFASMCPVISSNDSIIKMERLSKRYCVIVDVMKVNNSLKRKALMSKIITKPIKGMLPNAKVFLEFLEESGRKPSNYLVNTVSESSSSYQEAVEKFISYFKVFGYEGENVTTLIEEFVKENLENGRYVEKEDITYSVIIWEK